MFHLGKLTEAVIISKMRHQLAEVIEPFQYAYVPKLGTVGVLIKYVEEVNYYLNLGWTNALTSGPNS